jgi:hypothetical protein
MRIDRPSVPRFARWLAYLTLGGLGLVLHASLETGSLPQSFLYDGIGASAIAVALIAVWTLRPDRPATAGGSIGTVPRPALGQEPG